MATVVAIDSDAAFSAFVESEKGKNFSRELTSP
jgi:hypothetical protein